MSFHTPPFFRLAHVASDADSVVSPLEQDDPRRTSIDSMVPSDLSYSTDHTGSTHVSPEPSMMAAGPSSPAAVEGGGAPSTPGRELIKKFAASLEHLINDEGHMKTAETISIKGKAKAVDIGPRHVDLSISVKNDSRQRQYKRRAVWAEKKARYATAKANRARETAEKLVQAAHCKMAQAECLAAEAKDAHANFERIMKVLVRIWVRPGQNTSMEVDTESVSSEA